MAVGPRHEATGEGSVLPDEVTKVGEFRARTENSDRGNPGGPHVSSCPVKTQESNPSPRKVTAASQVQITRSPLYK